MCMSYRSTLDFSLLKSKKEAVMEVYTNQFNNNKEKCDHVQ